MAEYLFDPGYSKHLHSLIYTIEEIYGAINKFKNYASKKIKFKQYFPTILDLLDKNVEFYLGCLLWAIYLKSRPEGDIINNHCLGQEFNENDSLIELQFLMKFSEMFSRDTKYYLNQDFTFPDEYNKILEIYKEFAILNEGFTGVKKNTDIKLSNSLKTPAEDDLLKIKTVIDSVVKTGDFDELYEIKGLIL